MHHLRSRWRRTPIHRYFAGLDRCDQATFLIITALAFAIGVIFSALLLIREPATISAPRLPAPPFDMQLASTAGARAIARATPAIARATRT